MYGVDEKTAGYKGQMTGVKAVKENCGRSI